MHGELDKIIEKSLTIEPPAETASRPRRRPGGQPPYYEDGEGDESGIYGRQRKSLLKDIFSF